jgi:hypothetical protein
MSSLTISTATTNELLASLKNVLKSPKPKYSCVKFFLVFWNEEDEAESIQGARSVAQIFKERFGAVTTELILEPKCHSKLSLIKILAPTFEDSGDAENLVVYYITGHGSMLDQKTQLKVCASGKGSFAFRDFSDL